MRDTKEAGSNVVAAAVALLEKQNGRNKKCTPGRRSNENELGILKFSRNEDFVAESDLNVQESEEKDLKTNVKVRKSEERGVKVRKSEERDVKVRKSEERDVKVRNGAERDVKVRNGEERDVKVHKSEERDVKVRNGEERDVKVHKSEEERDVKARKSEERDVKVRKSEERDVRVRNGEERVVKLHKSEEERDVKVRKSEERDVKVRKGEERDVKVRIGEEKDVKVRKSEEERDVKVRKSEERDVKVRKSEERDVKVRNGEERDVKVRNGEERDVEVHKSEERDVKVRKSEERDVKVRKSEERDVKVRIGEEKDVKVRKSEEERYIKVRKSEERDVKLRNGEEIDDNIRRNEETVAKRIEEKDIKAQKSKERVQKSEENNFKIGRNEENCVTSSAKNSIKWRQSEKKDFKVRKSEETDLKAPKTEETYLKALKSEETDLKIQRSKATNIKLPKTNENKQNFKHAQKLDNTMNESTKKEATLTKEQSTETHKIGNANNSAFQVYKSYKTHEKRSETTHKEITRTETKVRYINPSSDSLFSKSMMNSEFLDSYKPNDSDKKNSGERIHKIEISEQSEGKNEPEETASKTSVGNVKKLWNLISPFSLDRNARETSPKSSEVATMIIKKINSPQSVKKNEAANAQSECSSITELEQIKKCNAKKCEELKSKEDSLMIKCREKEQIKDSAKKCEELKESPISAELKDKKDSLIHMKDSEALKVEGNKIQESSTYSSIIARLRSKEKEQMKELKIKRNEPIKESSLIEKKCEELRGKECPEELKIQGNEIQESSIGDSSMNTQKKEELKIQGNEMQKASMYSSINPKKIEDFFFSSMKLQINEDLKIKGSEVQESSINPKEIKDLKGKGNSSMNTQKNEELKIEENETQNAMHSSINPRKIEDLNSRENSSMNTQKNEELKIRLNKVQESSIHLKKTLRGTGNSSMNTQKNEELKIEGDKMQKNSMHSSINPKKIEDLFFSSMKSQKIEDLKIKGNEVQESSINPKKSELNSSVNTKKNEDLNLQGNEMQESSMHSSMNPQTNEDLKGGENKVSPKKAKICEEMKTQITEQIKESSTTKENELINKSSISAKKCEELNSNGNETRIIEDTIAKNPFKSKDCAINLKEGIKLPINDKTCLLTQKGRFLDDGKDLKNYVESPKNAAKDSTILVQKEPFLNDGKVKDAKTCAMDYAKEESPMSTSLLHKERLLNDVKGDSKDLDRRSGAVSSTILQKERFLNDVKVRNKDNNAISTSQLQKLRGLDAAKNFKGDAEDIANRNSAISTSQLQKQRCLDAAKDFKGVAEAANDFKGDAEATKVFKGDAAAAKVFKGDAKDTTPRNDTISTITLQKEQFLNDAKDPKTTTRLFNTPQEKRLLLNALGDSEESPNPVNPQIGVEQEVSPEHHLAGCIPDIPADRNSLFGEPRRPQPDDGWNFGDTGRSGSNAFGDCGIGGRRASGQQCGFESAVRDFDMTAEDVQKFVAESMMVGRGGGSQGRMRVQQDFQPTKSSSSKDITNHNGHNGNGSFAERETASDSSSSSSCEEGSETESEEIAGGGMRCEGLATIAEEATASSVQSSSEEVDQEDGTSDSSSTQEDDDTVKGSEKWCSNNGSSSEMSSTSSDHNSLSRKTYPRTKTDSSTRCNGDFQWIPDSKKVQDDLVLAKPPISRSRRSVEKTPPGSLDRRRRGQQGQQRDRHERDQKSRSSHVLKSPPRLEDYGCRGWCCSPGPHGVTAEQYFENFHRRHERSDPQRYGSNPMLMDRFMERGSHPDLYGRHDCMMGGCSSYHMPPPPPPHCYYSYGGDARGYHWSPSKPPDQDERVRKVQSERDNLQLQVQVLTEQIEAQSDKIGDLEKVLNERKQQLLNAEDLLQREMLSRSSLETVKLELMTTISELKLQQAALERENMELRNTAHINNNGLDGIKKPPFLPRNSPQATLTSTPVHNSNQIHRKSPSPSPVPASSASASPRRIDSGSPATVGQELQSPKTPPASYRRQIELQYASLPRQQFLSNGGAPPLPTSATTTPLVVVDSNANPSPAAAPPPAAAANGSVVKKGVAFGMGLSSLLGGRARVRSVPNLADTEKIVIDDPNNDSPQSPSLQFNKNKGIKKIFGKIKRSGSGNLEDFTGCGEFQRGGVRATASARLGWSEPTQIQNNGLIFCKPNKPFAEWDAETVCDWLQDLGLDLYVPEAKRWVKSGQQLIETNINEVEKELGIKNPLHKKKLQLALIDTDENSSSDPFLSKAGKLDTAWVLRWLDDVGLPQHKENFLLNRIDGRVLHRLTMDDLALLHVTSMLHVASIKRGIHVLRDNNYEAGCMQRRSLPDDPELPSPRLVALWTTHRVMEWLRAVDLAEYAPNLRGAGVHGGLMVHENKFTAELLASLLSIPPSKTLLRRHLNTHFNELLGKDIIQAKREAESTLGYIPLTPASKLKVQKKSHFSLKRNKSKSEADYGDLVCPLNQNSGENCQNGPTTPTFNNSMGTKRTSERDEAACRLAEEESLSGSSTNSPVPERHC